MKRICFIFILCAVSLILVSCTENLYSGVADKKTSEAVQDELEIAFIKGECAKVVQMLEPRAAFLTSSEQYKYTNAKLCLTGMNLTNIFDNIFDKNNPIDPFGMIESFMGTNVLDNKTIANLRDTYQDVISMCTVPNAVLDDNMKTVCGFAAAADTVLTVSEIAMTVTGAESVTVTNGGLSNLLVTNNVTTEKIDTALKAMPPEKQESLLGSVSTNINVVSGSVNVINSVMPDAGDISKQFDTLTKDLKDTSGNVTTSSLANFLMTSVVKNK